MEFETKSQKALVIKFPLNHWQKFEKGFWFKTYQVKIIFRVSWCNFNISDLNFLFKICFVCSILYAELSIYFYSVCVAYTYFFFHKYMYINFSLEFSQIWFLKYQVSKMLHWIEFSKVISPETCLRKKETKIFINVI